MTIYTHIDHWRRRRNTLACNLHFALLRVAHVVRIQPQAVDDRDPFTAIRPHLTDTVLVDQMSHDGVALKLYKVTQLADVHLDTVALWRLLNTFQALLPAVARVTRPGQHTQANVAMEVQFTSVRLNVDVPLPFSQCTRKIAKYTLLTYFVRTFGNTLGPLESGLALRVQFSSDVRWQARHIVFGLPMLVGIVIDKGTWMHMAQQTFQTNFRTADVHLFVSVLQDFVTDGCAVRCCRCCR